VLRDGSRVVIRPVVPADEQPLLRFLKGLSLDSRYRRFFSLCPDLARTARSSVPSGDDRCYGVVAVPPRPIDLVGHAGYWLTVGRRAEMAIAVADRLRGSGLGSILLAALAHHAVVSGVQVFEMDVLVENYPALRLFMRSGYPLLTRTLDGVVTCELLIGERSSESILRFSAS
jgi:GNAT superfamily N-acetyltransferase